MLQSLLTGEFLAIDSEGYVILSGDCDLDVTWHVECVTGELCFLSNAHPQVHKRIRCDMAGLLSLTDQWKGWEVFRIMECHHHYVKISSWMHSQWILCSDADGRVSTCTLSDSMKLDYAVDGNEFSLKTGTKCSKWAIEKHPSGPGVLIRSQKHGRLLSIDASGTLKTFSVDDQINASLITDAVDDASSETSTVASSTISWVGASWNKSLKGMKTRLGASLRKSSPASSPASKEVETKIPPFAMTVWHIEAAHSQTYYFGSIVPNKKPIIIGPAPEVTTNPRQADKLRLIRRYDNNKTITTKLYLTEKKQYIGCGSSDGTIVLLDNEEGDDSVGTDWIMDKSDTCDDGESGKDGGSTFRNTKYNLYLSYKEEQTAVEAAATAATEKHVTDADEDDQTETRENDSENAGAGDFMRYSPSHSQRFSNIFNSKTDPVATLVGISTLDERALWNLEPCMPRAVSSEKITTFAIGTSIAVGTTIAMPFALAGVAGVMGVMGLNAGVAFHVIAAGLSGAEFLASVGAIGATAYLVFRPAQNSLSDEQENDEEEGEREWSKRPFSNWRNW
jgi:hypothetical protein